jgi:hypothetical protein
MKAELLVEFDDALRDAFDYAQLKRLVNYMPGRRLEELAPVAGADLGTIVSELLGSAYRQGWLSELATQAIRQSPANAKLAQFYAKYQSFLAETPVAHRSIIENKYFLEPEELASLVDRVQQKQDIDIAIVESEANRDRPMIFVVKGPVDQLLDLFQTALSIDTIPNAMERRGRGINVGNERSTLITERVVFNTVQWSPRVHGMRRDDWLRRLAIQAARALGNASPDNFERSIQEGLDRNLVDRRSFLGIQYDLSSRDLSVLNDFCSFWRRFKVNAGICVILVKVVTSSALSLSSFRTFFHGLATSREVGAERLESLGNVFPEHVTTWWNLIRVRLPNDSAVRTDPAADVFIEGGEKRHGITMKQLRDRLRSLSGFEFFSPSKSHLLVKS